MKRRISLITIAAGLLFFSSCSTYIIPLDSFKQQFAGIDSTNLKEVAVRGPMGGTYYYQANPITTIQCQDKKGNPAQLQNSPSIEIRFTYGEKGKRTIFYFDRIFVSDSSVVGVQSRFFQSIRKSIALSDIKKIEVQDGKKDFHYINKR